MITCRRKLPDIILPMDSTLIWVLAISLLASFVQRVSGFGFGIVAMAVFTYLLPSYGEATALSGMLGALTSVITAVRMRREVPWKKLLPILVTFLIVSFFAVRVVSRVDSAAMKKVLGGVLICVSLYFFFLSERIRIRPGTGMQIGMGTVSGVMGGLFAMQGPPAVIYFISSADTNREYIAMTQWYFFIGNVMMTVYRAGKGLVTGTVLLDWAVCAPAVVAGILIGGLVSGRIHIKLLRKIVYAFLALSGVISLVG